MIDNTASLKLDQRPSIVGTDPVSTEEALADVHKLMGKVVLVTGAASGFGKEYALRAAAAGAILAISDLSLPRVEAAAKEMREVGGTVYADACNIVDWDQQVEFFDKVVKEYGRIDVVVANAGVGELPGSLDDRRVTEEGKPAKPATITSDVNLTGTFYTVRLAFFHLRRQPAASVASSATGPAAPAGHILILGSMASFLAIPLAPLYSASKHAMMGLFRSLEHDARAANLSLSLVCPWFCTSTGILGPEVVFSLAGLPLTDQTKVVDAMLLASVTDRCGDALAIDAEGILRVPGPAMCYDFTQTNYYTSFQQRAIFVINLRQAIKEAVVALTKPSTRFKVKLAGAGLAAATAAGMAVLVR